MGKLTEEDPGSKFDCPPLQSQDEVAEDLKYKRTNKVRHVSVCAEDGLSLRGALRNCGSRLPQLPFCLLLSCAPLASSERAVFHGLNLAASALRLGIMLVVYGSCLRFYVWALVARSVRRDIYASQSDTKTGELAVRRVGCRPFALPPETGLALHLGLHDHGMHDTP